MNSYPRPCLFANHGASAVVAGFGFKGVFVKFRPLTKDYWPDYVQRPIGRLVIAAITAPLLISVGLMTVFALVQTFAPYADLQPGGALGSPLDLFFALTLEIYLFCLIAVAPAFFALWSLRLRSRRAFVIAGLLGAAIGVLFHLARFGPLTLAQILIAPLLSVGLALLLRALAGLGAPPSNR